MTTIRPAKSEDHDAIWGILEPVYRAGETYCIPRDISRGDALADWFAAPFSAFVAEQGGEVLGTSHVGRNRPGGASHVANASFATAPAARGRGVAAALVAHAKVAEAAVVGYPHPLKGQGIYAYVTLMNGIEPSDALRAELEKWVRTEIGPIAKPDLIQWAPGLPKTRSGKIMRRILRKIAEDEFGNLGDTSTLADPTVVDDLVNNRQNKKAEAKAGA